MYDCPTYWSDLYKFYKTKKKVTKSTGIGKWHFTHHFSFVDNPIDEFLTKVRDASSAQIVDKIKKLLYNNDKWQEMTSYIKDIEVKTKLSHRNEDPKWFEGNWTKTKTVQ